MIVSLIYRLPIGLTALVFLGVLLSFLEISFRIGLWRSRKIGEGRATERRGDVVLSAMLGILGLVLAFTYAFTASRSDHRKSAVLEHVNSLGTAFQLADLLDEPHRSKIRRLLLDYTRSLLVEAKDIETSERLQETIVRITESQKPIWPAVKDMVADTAPSPLRNSFVQSINEVSDAQTRRLTATLDRLPSAILIMLIFVAGASLSVAGYSAGRADKLRRWRTTALAMILAAVMVVITDFDRPLSGYVRTSQQGYVMLIQQMEVGLNE